jgi:RHS repeat-associated protein
MTLCSLSSGLTYSTVYGDGGRNITNTMPGGLTQITHNNYSRKIKESIGSAAINQFYDYFIDPDGSMTDVDLWSFLFDKRSLIARIHSGTSGSSRWKLQGTDAWGEEVYQGAPASQNSTNIVYMENSYSTFGWLMESFDSTKGSWNKMSYDVNGNNCISDVSASYYEGFGYDGDPAFYLPFLSSEKTGNSRITETSRGLCQIGVAWYQSATNYAYLEDGNDNKCVQSIHLEQLNGFSGNEISNSIDYDADGNVTTNTTVIDRNNNVLTQITSTPNTSSQNAVTIYQNGRILSYSTLSVANPTTCSYDAFGRTNLIQDPQGNYMSMTYDPATGWLTSLTGAAGHTTFYSYYPVNQTNAGKLYCQTDANNKKTYYAYTPQGQLCQTWGDVPYPAEYRYNEYGDLTNLITFRGGSSWTGSTWAGDSGGDNTYWQYDEASGSLLSKTDAQGRSVNYTYYPETGLLFTRSWGRTFTDASNNIFSVTVTNLYDTTYFDETLGRYCDDGSGYGDMTAQCYNDGTPNVYFNDYSRVGQPREIVDGSGTNELIYDFSSRLVSTTCTNGLLSGITVSNHFNPYCGRDVLKVINTTGTPWTLEDDYGYDHNSGRLASVSSGTALATYGYVPNSDLLQSTTFANSGSTVMTTTRTWNHGFQLASIANTVAGASIPVTSHAYTYDAVNRRAEAKLEDGSAWLYGYNDRNELASANRQWLDTRPVAGQQFGYNYDNIGNRTWAQFGGDTNGNNLQTINYTANSLNQYTNIVTPGLVDVLGAALETNAVIVNAGLADRHGEYFHRQISIANTNQPVWQTVTNIAGTFTNKGGLTFPANSQTLVYDADGNLVSDGVWLYQWDGENRLISMWMTNVIAGIAASNTLKLDFAYDYLGRRVSKTVSKWNVSTSSYEASTTNYFVYDGWNLISIINPQSTNLVSFVWGNDLSGTITKGGGVGGLLIANISGTNCFAGYDGNGNISVFINSADKSLAARYEYSPYGQLIRKTGLLAAQIPIRFSTKFWDEETGLINYNARYYSPCLGKWMGRDPTADQIFLNLYLFSHNNPLNRFDKDGKDDLTLGDVMAACCASVAMDADMCMSLIITAGEGSSFGEFVGALNASVSCMASSVGAAASTAVYGSLAATGTTEVASTVLAGICGYFGNSVKGVTGIPGTESTVSAWSNIAGQVANKMNSPMGLQIINDAYNATIYLLSSDDGDDNSVWNINDDSDSN